MTSCRLVHARDIEEYLFKGINENFAEHLWLVDDLRYTGSYLASKSSSP